ncbi:estradiol 17-beta-dehydrogenase 1 [Huso huso]|uniref:Estradiol 17-beta-dehydrogenase 1 n=1 Tax=Huso huso TaxID=61971 RepID=A0ABR0YC59_HUSHU
MDKTVVLITGCSSGIGLGLAVRLASDTSKAFIVYATMRNLSKKERLLECVRGCHEDTMEILQMDVTDQLSIQAAKQRIKEKKVDILVCNAGAGLMGPVETQSYETMKQIFDVNLFGTICTIQAFLPEMKERKSGRIIVTGSVGGLQGIPFNDVYCASKFAVEGFCESLAILLQHFNIHISLIECGPVNTNFMTNLQRTDPEDPKLQHVDPETTQLYQKYLQHCERVFEEAAQDTEEIVQVFMDAIGAQFPSLRYYTNTTFLPLTKLKLSVEDGTQYIKAMNKFVFSTHKTGDF